MVGGNRMFTLGRLRLFTQREAMSATRLYLPFKRIEKQELPRFRVISRLQITRAERSDREMRPGFGLKGAWKLAWRE